jgi:hypothetical protein
MQKKLRNYKNKKNTVGAESVKDIFIRLEFMKGSAERVLACGTSIRQHTSAYVSASAFLIRLELVTGSAERVLACSSSIEV